MEHFCCLAEGSGFSPARVWFWVGAAGLTIGVIGSLFPMWKSAALSPDSIMRRFYWAGSGFFTLCIFISQIPDWKGGTSGSAIFGLCLVLIAFFRSSHIKIGNTIYAAWPSYRRPDRPPALADDAHD